MLAVEPKDMAAAEPKAPPPPRRADSRAEVARARAAIAGLRQPADMYHPSSMPRWDATMLLCLAFTALVTPFELGFLEGPKTWGEVDALFAVNRLVDALFARDIWVNFRLGYYDRSRGCMVWSKAAVARRYARSWLAVDLVSVVPFDVVALALASSGLSFLKLLRVVRLLRVIKLLRIAKSARVVAQLRLSLGWSYATFAIAVMLCATVACIHLIACAYGLVGKVRERERVPSLDRERSVVRTLTAPRRARRPARLCRRGDDVGGRLLRRARERAAHAILRRARVRGARPRSASSASGRG